MSFTYKYARPAITADCVIFTYDQSDLKVLLIQRAQEPFKGQWALPGGFAEVGESLDNTARRELEEETGLNDIPLEQLYTFSDPDRDPREHVITVAYYALVNLEDQEVKAASDASKVEWFSIDDLPVLAFDHSLILQMACKKLHIKPKE
ncbi:MAG: NUDIX hydrolase [Gammaproteobacteria bacterium]|nr:NUDIX hydrolase [Gammaproteobacteria bacterium]